jgi:outer membrane usher protein
MNNTVRNLKFKKILNKEKVISKKNKAKTIKVISAYVYIHIIGFPACAHAADIPQENIKTKNDSVNRIKTDEIEFDPKFLYNDPSSPSIDLSKFKKSTKLIAGKYRFDVLINRIPKGLNEISIIEDSTNSINLLCINKAQLENWGISFEKIRQHQELNHSVAPTDIEPPCYDVKKNIPGTSTDADQGEQKLTLTIPEIFMQNIRTSTYASPDTWQEGENGLLINYNSNYFKNNEMQSAYIGINGSANVQRWRLKHTGSLTWDSSNTNQTKYKAGFTYLQTDNTTLKSQLIIGETITNGSLFDSISLKGVQLYSDDRMFEDVDQSYAPIVHGVANGNAKVTIYQKEQLIYETTVAPGPFILEDVQAQTDGGDLKVIVTEANGTKNSFIVPYAYSPELLRVGQNRYSVAFGKINHTSYQINSGLIQGIFRHGFSGNWTGFTGVTYLKNYSSILIESALNTKLGTFSTDITHSIFQSESGDSQAGNSIRFAFSKSLPASGTNISIISYNYSSNKYLTLNSAARLFSNINNNTTALSLKQKQRLDININKTINTSSIYLNSSILQYWHTREKSVNISAGYSNSWKNIYYTAALQRSKESYNNQSSIKNSITLNISIPFGKEGHRSSLNSTLTYEKTGNTLLNTSISGRINNDDNSTYTAYGSTSSSSTLNGGVRLGYLFPKTAVSVGMSSGSGYQQYSASATGALLLHSEGITLSQATGETIALVNIPNGEGAAIGISKVPVDKNGYAIISNLTPYHNNKIDLTTQKMPLNIELTQDTNKVVTPRAGAIMQIKYNTQSSYSTIINSTLPNGTPLPFAANVFNKLGENVGIVSQGSRLLVKDIGQNGTLLVKWGNSTDSHCTISYDFNNSLKNNDLTFNSKSEICHPDQ